MSAIIRTMFTNFSNAGNMVGNKNGILADLGNVGQDHCLLRINISWLLHDRFQPNVHQNDAVRQATKA